MRDYCEIIRNDIGIKITTEDGKLTKNEAIALSEEIIKWFKNRKDKIKKDEHI